jgi:hypothetical protein
MMRKNIFINLFILTIIFLAVIPYGETEEKELSTLTGIIHHNTKALTPARLDIDGGGTIDLCGSKIGEIKDGTRILVRGKIKSELFVPKAPSPFFTQWIVCMWVEEVEIIDKPFGDLIKEEIQNENK